jgi:lipopolysaccharide/colanic/teichoic acid biosynthesis glycosyltransferase
VTSLGAFLRRSSIDELPQLWNVLRGEMSLVGPRPDVTYSVDAYEPWMFRRLAATPGMTGLWQVSGRSRLGLRAMLRLDVEYVERRSLLLDLKILLMTIPAVTSTKNAA